MQRFTNFGKHMWVFKTVAFFVMILMLFSLCAWPMNTDAEGLTTFTVTTTEDNCPGSLRAAIDAANLLPPGSFFAIAIDTQGTFETASALPTLMMDQGKSGWIKSNPNATITCFSCLIGAGRLTLHNVIIDNSAYNLGAISVAGTSPASSLLLSGNNRISGSSNANIYGGPLTIDKAPGGSDTDSTLILTGTRYAMTGGLLRVKGGTLEARGQLIGLRNVELFVTGGRLIATGNGCGILEDESEFGAIYGGTVVASGRFDIASGYIVINGGSVEARELQIYSIPDKPTDGIGNEVYLVTVAVGATPVKNTEVSCSVNGGAEFSSITDDEGKLYLWMPAGEGIAVIDVGGTVFQAEGEVEENFDNAMLALEVVTKVVASPAFVTSVSGSTVQFSARVEGNYNPPQTVIWSVENAQAGTAIDSTGLLTISAKESTRTLQVTATSAFDKSKSSNAQVYVISVTSIILGGIFLLFLLVLVAVYLEMKYHSQR